MGIKIKHGRPETMLTTAALAGEARKQEEIQKMQMEFDYRQTLRQQDIQIDLQMQERAKLWEIQKMELRSQVDFQREEQARQRKLDSYDNALQQIDKEVLAGRMTEQEAYPLKLKYEMNKMGVDAPTSLLPTGDEEERYGVRPYWMRGRDAPEGTPERQLYEAKLAEGISGERRGTIPYYLDPEWLRANRDIAMSVLEKHEIMLEEEDIDALIRGAEGGAGGQVTVISPTGEEGTIPIEDLDEALAEGYIRMTELPLGNKQLDVGVQSEPVGVRERLEAGKAKFYKPSLSRFATMSPLRLLMERRKAKKIVR